MTGRRDSALPAGCKWFGNSVLRWFQVSQERVGYVVIARGGNVHIVVGFALARGTGSVLRWSGQSGTDR
jgi:hypothetical protein